MALLAIYTDESAAREHLEGLLWPNGPVCPHCGNCDGERIHKLQGKSTRPGVYKCRECEKPFTVTVGTVMERSKIPLHQWVYATHLLTSSKKGISAHQIGRMLGLTYKSAWFLCHRIREAMRPAEFSPMGGSGRTVEIDETIIGKVEGAPKRIKRGGNQHRNIVLTLVERGGRARSFHIDGTTSGTLIPIIRMNISRESALHTDQATWYKGIGAEYADHQTVNHQIDEYVRGNVTTNTVEGYYSIFKRGMKGVYRIRELEQEIARFKDWEADKKRYELKELYRGLFAYIPKEGMENGEPPHALCTNCYQRGQKSLLQTSGHVVAHDHFWFCPHCKTSMKSQFRDMSGLIKKTREVEGGA